VLKRLCQKQVGRLKSGWLSRASFRATYLLQGCVEFNTTVQISHINAGKYDKSGDRKPQTLKPLIQYSCNCLELCIDLFNNWMVSYSELCGVYNFVLFVIIVNRCFASLPKKTAQTYRGKRFWQRARIQAGSWARVLWPVVWAEIG